MDKKRPNWYIMIGLLLGSLGIVFIFKDNLGDIVNPVYFWGMLITFAAGISWAIGSVYAKYKPSKSNVLTNASIQMFAGGAILFVMSPFLDDYSELKSVSGESIWSLLYLIFFGSILAYSSFVYALSKLPLGIASLYSYINPFIALLLGYLLLQEPVTWFTFLALATALSGIFFINKGYINSKN